MYRELDHVQQVTTDVVRSIGADDWGRPTPCPGWDVETVVRHVVVGDRAFTVLLGGTPYDLPALDAAVAAVPVADLPDVREEALVEFRRAFVHAPADTYETTPLGPISAQAIAALRASEWLVHAWDVAQALGTGDRLLAAVDGRIAAALEAASRNLMDRMPAEAAPFAPPKPAPDGAPALLRYVAYLGRDV